MNKYFILAIILIIVIGSGYLVLQGRSKMQSNNTVSQQTNEQNTKQPSKASQPSTAIMSTAVNYTEDGFQPHTITIKVGQTVTWTNKDSDGLWVASNPHPTHTDYPGFDELKSIPTGQKYSFTFTKVGNWGYHNHLNPSQMGVVIVTQ